MAPNAGPPVRRRPPRRRSSGRRSPGRRIVPPIRFPAELPVSAHIDELAAAIDGHQVVIVAGETGSGKSTQLPKLCLKLGRGVRGRIGHTQPRRIAARALAERIAEETGTTVGGLIGYTIRFGDHTGPGTAVKLMTDGILLAEIARDPDLRTYDTIIIDEAHERSLNIDFLLGYLARLLPRRPDLKVIVTSATIDPDRFARHFGGAPVIEVSGRTFPVQIRYRPYGLDGTDGTGGADEIDEDDPPADGDRPSGNTSADEDQAGAIVRAVDELFAEGDGDILVFLSGEREITDTAEVLRGHLAGRGALVASTEVLPLYGRLSVADQHRVFAAHRRRRIVLATNVAETSLTVPGIRYVIDPGTARISRYSPRTKVQRLPIEKISRASAAQRAGRCGRLADGICIRLYSDEDFAARPEFTDPEIARTSLASVILKMTALGMGRIETFPFLDAPDPRRINDGMTVLTELSALERGGGVPRLTPIGRSLAALPLDPRLARMIVEGQRRGCLAEILVIVSALAIRDVREHPLQAREQAATAHARFTDPASDFLTILNLWEYLAEQARSLSGNAFRRRCRADFLHYLRIREWQDLHAQLAGAAAELGMDPSASARTSDGIDRAAVHTALAAGLLSHVGSLIEADQRPARGRKTARTREYQGTRGTRFAIWPGSGLARAGAGFVLAAELVETSRLWARTVAAVDPGWVEEVGGDLLRRSYSEPRFSAKRQAVVATERVLLLGVTLQAARTVLYDRIDPAAARELLIRRGLVEGELATPLPFLAANNDALDAVIEQERRSRRRGIAIDDEALFALYDERIPADVTSGRRLESWWRKESRSRPDALTFTPEMLIAAGAELAGAEQYPDRIRAGELEVELGYVFDPGAPDDGVSATVPLAALPALDPGTFPAQVPGLRRELAIALIRSLPKPVRRSIVPAPDFADAALDRIGDEPGSLPEQLAAALTAIAKTPVTAGDFDPSKVPDHLRMSFLVVDDAGRQVAKSKDLSVIQRALRADSRQALARLSAGLERSGLVAFPVDGLPRETSALVGGGPVTGYPALIDEGTTAGIRVFADRAAAAGAMRAGTRRLVALGVGDVTRALAGRLRQLAAPRPSAPGAAPALSRDDLLQLAVAPHGSSAALLSDAIDAAIDALLAWAGGPAWDLPAFESVRARIAGQLEVAALDVLRATADVLRAGAEADRAIEGARESASAGVVADLRAERTEWLAPGFVTAVGAAHLPDVARYLRALAVRARRLAENPERERRHADEIVGLRREMDVRLAALGPERQTAPDVAALRRLLAEYRITLFAQPMRTAVPVSAKRVRAAIAALPD